MNKKTYQINIPEPCNEDWNKMTPQEQGRFCGKCEKIIVDYTLQPDRVIAKAFKESNGQICGRFRSDQLQRDLVLEPQFYQNTRWKAFGLMLSGLLAAGSLKGQDTPPSHSLDWHQNISIDSNSKQKAKTAVIISGQIIDRVSKESLIAANVIVKGTSNWIFTAIEGDFQLEIPKDTLNKIDGNLILEISYSGFETVEYNVKLPEIMGSLSEKEREAVKGQPLKIKLSPISMMKEPEGEELIVIGYGTGRYYNKKQQH